MKIIIKFNGSAAQFIKDDEVLFVSQREIVKKKNKWYNLENQWFVYNKDAKVIATIGKVWKKWFTYNSFFEINFQNTEVLREPIEFIYKGNKPRYEGELQGEFYQIVKHKGRKFSIFCGNKQIGFFENKAVSFGWVTRYDLYINRDVKLDYLAVLLTLVLSKEDFDGAEINIDFGYIGKEFKKFDYNWLPK